MMPPTPAAIASKCAWVPLKPPSTSDQTQHRLALALGVSADGNSASRGFSGLWSGENRHLTSSIRHALNVHEVHNGVEYCCCSTQHPEFRAVDCGVRGSSRS
jgi:acyl-CoA thioesterase